MGASSALANCSPTYADQGDLYRGAGNDNGTRSYLQGTTTLNSCGGVVATVAEQEKPPDCGCSGFGMIQTGYIEESSTFASDCDMNDPGITAVMTEYTADSVNYTCDVYIGGQHDLFGEGDLFTAALGSGGWETFWDGQKEYTITGLGFSSGYSVARGEAKWGSSNPAFNVTWGPSGKTAWQYKTDSSGCCTSYTNVLSGATKVNDGLWSIGTPPSPFSIKFIG